MQNMSLTYVGLTVFIETQSRWGWPGWDTLHSPHLAPIILTAPAHVTELDALTGRRDVYCVFAVTVCAVSQGGRRRRLTKASGSPRVTLVGDSNVRVQTGVWRAIVHWGDGLDLIYTARARVRNVLQDSK